MLKISVLLVMLAYVTAMQAQQQWEVSGMMSRGLNAATAVLVDSTVYVLGGYSDSVQSGVDWIQKFNPETGKFVSVGRMKVRRHYLVAAVKGKYIYYTGGEYRGNHHSLGILERFDTETNTVTAIDSNKKFNRYAMSTVIRDSMMYFIGGDSYDQQGGGGNQSPYIMEYNLNRREITYNYMGLFSGNHLRSGQMTRLIDKYIYIFGGAYNTVLSEVYRYDLQLKKLNRIFPNMLVPRANGSAIVPYNDGEFLLTGGFNEGSSALSSVERFRLSDSTNINNQPVAPLLYRRRNHMSVLYKGYIYIFGGASDFNNYVKQIERLQIITGVEEENTGTTAGDTYFIGQNYPNPFNPSTEFEVYVPVEGMITVSVYDASGSMVEVLESGYKAAGTYRYQWNASGRASGIYYCALKATPARGSESKIFRQTRKMLLIK